MVSLGRLAALSDVTPGTVTTMMKSLADAGFVDYLPRQGVVLTERGKKDATGMLRRHRLIELFLVETLGFDWSEVHPEAEILEHAVSDRIVDRIDELLGFPAFDPHGDPIPSANGNITSAMHGKLSDAAPGSSYRISRVTNDEPAFLGFLKEKGLVPGQLIEVIERDDNAGTILVGTNVNEVTMSLIAASRVLIRSD